MKKLLYILLFSSSYLFSQNLVPNCSFEDTSACPEGMLGWIDYATGWHSTGDTGSSPDYFHPCGAFPMVPYNAAGYQYPASGIAYTGIAIYVKGLSSGKEFIGRQLSIPLSIGQSYYVSFKVSFTLNPWELGYAANKMGVLFSTALHDTSNPAPVNNFAHVYTNQIITDSVGWTTISGWVTADSVYQYINIGNFFDDANTDTIAFNDSLWGAYYYIDNICVSLDSTNCSCVSANAVENYIPQTDIQVYNDAYDAFITINNNEIKSISLSLYDLFGREVKRVENISERKIQIDKKNLTSGIYVLKIYYLNKTFTKKIILSN